MLMVHITYISFQLANSLTLTCHLLFTRGIIISVVFLSPMENWRHESSCHFLKGINSKQQNWYYKLLSWHLHILTPKPKHQTHEHKSLNPQRYWGRWQSCKGRIKQNSSQLYNLRPSWSTAWPTICWILCLFFPLWTISLLLKDSPFLVNIAQFSLHLFLFIFHFSLLPYVEFFLGFTLGII